MMMIGEFGMHQNMLRLILCGRDSVRREFVRFGCFRVIVFLEDLQ